METQFEIENKYLRAKIAYYEGNPIMSDDEFDILEMGLKTIGSKVVNQVGAKRKDFDFQHPNPMLSLGKIQTEEGNIMYAELKAWYDKRIKMLSEKGISFKTPLLEWLMKYDGNAINCIYKGNKLVEILTRGDGISGKNVTNKISSLVPSELILSNITDPDSTYEIRCEAVMPLKAFEKVNKERIANGEQEFANARNFIAGVLGDDKIKTNYINDIVLIPLHLLENGNHLSVEYLVNWKQLPRICKSYMSAYDVNFFNEFVELRKTSPFGLDGIVVSFPAEYRKYLGQNDHDPEWSIAIKFVPEETSTDVVGIEWNVGKTGELAPVVLLKPVTLAGTIVKRASGYNGGYIIKNKIGVGAKVSISKAGDIIPEIISILSPATSNFDLPEDCPMCGNPLTFDNIHLMCNNDSCDGKMIKRFGVGAKVLDLKGVAGKTLTPFVGHFDSILDLFVWVRENAKDETAFEVFDFKLGSRSLEIFIKAFTNIKTIPLAKVIESFGLDNIGKSITREAANFYCGAEYDFKCQEKVLVELVKSDDFKTKVFDYVNKLEALGVKIEMPKNKNSLITNTVKNAPIKEQIYAELTGSPKPQWKTKEEFMELFTNLENVALSDSKCKYLITDSYSSTSGKMKAANKKGIKIITYNDFYKQYK